MSKHTFEDFLMEKHAEQFIGTKDEMIGDFPNWLDDLEIDDWFQYADKFQKQINVELLEACIYARKTIDEILSYTGAKFNLIPHHSGRGAIRLDSIIDSLEQAITKAEGR